jgi:hypothetical protein
MRGDCFFCWYWCMFWTSLFILLFIIYYYLCNQCLSPLMLWVRISIRAWCTTLCDKVCQWLTTGRWFPPPIKLTAVALDTIKQTNIHFLCYFDKFNRWNSCLLFSIFSKSPRSIYILLCTYKPYTFSIFNIQSCLWPNKSNKNLSSEKSTQSMSDK